MKEEYISIIIFLSLFTISSLFIGLFIVISLSNMIIVILVTGGITWIYSIDGKQKNIKMVCNIGLASEFKDCFTETQQFRIYERKEGTVCGTSHFHKGKAWIFIDRIALYSIRYDYDIIEEITDTVIHELIHLCGVHDEETTLLGEKLVK